tara:strand:- start:36 stop:578 length:543 start_codon:yes stop_codon:yes gene_type:complete
MITNAEIESTKELYRAILSQAIQDALYVFNKSDEESEKKYQKKMSKWKFKDTKRQKKLEKKIKIYKEYINKQEKKYQENLTIYNLRKKSENKSIYKIKEPKLNLSKAPMIPKYKIFSKPVRPQIEITWKRDALHWLYGKDKKNLWMLELCCDISNVTKEQVVKLIESKHNENFNGEYFEK